MDVDRDNRDHLTVKLDDGSEPVYRLQSLTARIPGYKVEHYLILLSEPFHTQSSGIFWIEVAHRDQEKRTMAVGAKIAKTADRKKVMDTSKSTDCPKCGKTTRIVKRMKDRERGVPGGIYISCSACEFFEKL
jgi:DNA-directed RNA polymerase subunit M/transcription elongation factor TFIIS